MLDLFASIVALCTLRAHLRPAEPEAPGHRATASSCTNVLVATCQKATAPARAARGVWPAAVRAESPAPRSPSTGQLRRARWRPRPNASALGTSDNVRGLPGKHEPTATPSGAASPSVTLPDAHRTARADRQRLALPGERSRQRDGQRPSLPTRPAASEPPSRPPERPGACPGLYHPLRGSAFLPIPG